MKEHITVIRGYQKNVVHDPLSMAFSGMREAGVRIACQFWSCLELSPAGGPANGTTITRS